MRTCRAVIADQGGGQGGSACLAIACRVVARGAGKKFDQQTGVKYSDMPTLRYTLSSKDGLGIQETRAQKVV